METIDEVRLRGIRGFQQHNRTTHHQYDVESRMQKKIKNRELLGQRNQISVTTLGDKPYKYPQYSKDFYQTGGLIPGSTIKPRQKNPVLDIKGGSIFTKPNWGVKVKLEEIDEDKKVVNSVDEWEQTILKEANPNWNDPDTFFQRM